MFSLRGRDDRRPVLRTNTPNHQESRLIDGHCRNLDQVRVIPEFLSLDEVDTMLLRIGTALPFVEVEREHGMENIPLWTWGATEPTSPS